MTAANTNDPNAFNIDRDIPSLEGKVVFVTGGTAGLGAQSVQHLAGHKPEHIYFTGRNQKAANALIESISRVHPSTPISFIEMDMSSLVSISQAMKPYILAESTKRIKHVDILIASAGVMATPGLNPWTKDGFEAHFGINHVGTALIIKTLLPAILAAGARPNTGARVVLLTSLGWKGHPRPGIDFEAVHKDIVPQGTDLSMGTASKLLRDLQNYGQSKLANILYAKELARRYGDQGVTAVAVHPGVVTTSLVGGLSWSWRWLVKLTNWHSMVSPEEGVRNQLWASVAPGVPNGKWFLPVGRVGDEKGTKAEDSELAAKLWTWTEDVFKGIDAR